MKPGYRLLIFLILNVIVSATTTLLVLNWYRSANPYPTLFVNRVDSDPSQAETPGVPVDPAQPKATLPSLDKKVVEIQNIFGAGDLNLEVVVIRRSGDGDLLMTGWQLQDEQGNRFVFPDLTLFKDGAVQVYTRTGDNTATTLYWKRSKPAWQPGKNVYLVDPQGNIRSTFTIK